MCQDESRVRCYCVIPNALQTSLLVREVNGLWECPFLLLPEQRLKFFPDYVSYLRQELRREANLEVTVLRHLQDLEDVQVCLLEIHSSAGSPPENYRWLDASKEIEWADEHSFQAWQAWSMSQAGGGSLALAPWEQRGWFANAALWTQDCLHSAGYEINGPVEQLKGAWSWSSLLTADTKQGRVYFKADYGKPPQEAAVIGKLTEHWPRNVPHIIAADAKRNWMLMSDFAGESLDVLSGQHYSNAVSQFAKIQRSTASDMDSWSLLGCPEMTPSDILWLTQCLIADTSVVCGGKNGLRPEELTALALKMPQIERILTLLATSPLPNVISNEDFKAGNVVVQSGDYLFYDWSSTVIAHPLFGINYFLNRMVRSASDDRFRWRNDLADLQRRILLTAFLSEWTNYAEWDQLVAEVWLCRRLCSLYEAVRCYCDLPFIDTTSPWGAGTLAFIPQALRSLLAALDYQPEKPNIERNHEPLL